MKRGAVLFISLIICSLGFSQADSLKFFPGQISFVYPLGTSGIQSINYKYTLSINVLQGSTGAVEGVEFGGLVNTNRASMKGAQFAGIANLTGTWVDGVQFAGICNIVGGPVLGGQFAGIAGSVLGSCARQQGAYC